MTDTSQALVKEQAIHWLARLHSGHYTDAERAAFAAWLAENKAHRHTFDEVQRLWNEMEGLRTLAARDLAAARTYRPRPAWRGWRGAALALACAGGLAAALLVVIPAWWETVPAQVFHTAKGEQKTVTLPDGSRLDLNTDTELRLELSRQDRSITLARGEVLFTVVHDETRPFIITAGAGRIRDIGTRFDVRFRPDGVSVAVLEGKVSIVTGRDDVRVLQPGQAISYSATGRFSRLAATDPAVTTAWREGKLVFKGRPLREVLDEIGRYHDVDLELFDPELAALKVSGTFGIEDLGLLLGAMEASLPVRITRVDERRVQVERSRSVRDARRPTP